MIGVTGILAILGILVVEGIRNQRPDALAMVAFALTAAVMVVLLRQMPEASP